MKLVRVGAPGEERPAVRIEEGRLFDLSSVTSDIDGAFLASDGIERARAAVAAGSLPELDTDGVRVGAPVARPGMVTADEVAAAVVYLASPAAGSVTGIALAVDGGMQGLRLRPAAGA
ncbi:NAD(P)-dependent dehydrogenase (short-subunit alcohol dehydrogenase family) [Streptomyces achromogenes]|nr:NAD(P)-dependent dehydrogenase (short-subunit alcohol dehydrogenase family) [Streptomyces achromogenes]